MHNYRPQVENICIPPLEIKFLLYQRIMHLTF